MSALAIIKDKEPAVYAIHTELRKDGQRFQSVAHNWEKLDDQTFTAIKNYFDIHLTHLHEHHQAEDKHFFPAYRQRSPELASMIDKLEEQHHELIGKMHSLQGAFAENQRHRLAELFEDYTSFVEKHLSNEEETMIKIFDHYTEQEMKALSDAYANSVPKKELILKLPWLLDGMDDDMRRNFFKTVPFFVPFIYKLLKRDFDRRIRVFAVFT